MAVGIKWMRSVHSAGGACGGTATGAVGARSEGRGGLGGTVEASAIQKPAWRGPPGADSVHFGEDTFRLGESDADGNSKENINYVSTLEGAGISRSKVETGGDGPGSRRGDRRVAQGSKEDSGLKKRARKGLQTQPRQMRTRWTPMVGRGQQRTTGYRRFARGLLQRAAAITLGERTRSTFRPCCRSTDLRFPDRRRIMP